MVFKAFLDRGFSFPPSPFFLQLLSRYNAQLHNFPPNSILAASAYVSLCEGYLGVAPSIELFEYFYGIKREPVEKNGELAICGSIRFKSRSGRNYPEVKGHDSVKDWQAGFFYVKNEVAPGTEGIPAFVPTRAEENENWAGRGNVPTDHYLIRCIRRIDQLMLDDLKGLDLVLCWMKRRI